MHVEDSESKLGVPYLVDCDDDGNKCILDIVTITDFKTSSEDKVQVYISGSLQGHERLGPQIAFYLIEYLVSNFKRDVFITNLLQTREIIITPMTNAYGYAKNTRKELTYNLDSNNTVSRDPLRDFPYNNTESACLNTVAARTLYRLFVDNLFVTAITFHGGYNTAIGYPWGSINHRTQTSPGEYIG
jgi:predicted deacylase